MEAEAGNDKRVPFKMIISCFILTYLEKVFAKEFHDQKFLS